MKRERSEIKALENISGGGGHWFAMGKKPCQPRRLIKKKTPEGRDIQKAP